MVLTTSLSESWRAFLSNRQQRTKINTAFCCYSEIIYGVPQESILGLLLFNIYVCDMFFEIIKCDIAYDVDDNTPYNVDFSLGNVIRNLEKSTNSLLNLFKKNHVKANADKCHLLVSSNERCTAKIKDFSVTNNTEEKLIGVKFDSNSFFECLLPLFVKGRVRIYTFLQEYHIT